MAEYAVMLSEALTVVRGDYDPRPFQYSAARQLVGQLAKLFVESGDAIVVGVAGKSNLPRCKLASCPMFASVRSDPFRALCVGPARNDGRPVPEACKDNGRQNNSRRRKTVDPAGDDEPTSRETA